MEKEDIKKKFNRIFWNKGNIGPIAEKARRNFELIHKNEINRTGRVYHFCVAHAFKNLDKSVFESEFNEEKETLAPTKFLKLQKENFTFENELLRLLESIRNLNSHYVHTFDCLEVSKINVQLVSFIKEAFHFSVLINYLKENNKNYDEFKLLDKNPLIDYLRDKFFPNKEHQKEEREDFSKLNLDKALEELLLLKLKKNLIGLLIMNTISFQ